MPQPRQPHPPFPLCLVSLPILVTVLQIMRMVDSTLTISSIQISALATYTIQISQFATTVPAGSIIQLEVSGLYSADDLRAGLPYAGDGTTGSCPIDCNTVAVEYSGFVFNITGMFTSDAQLVFKYSILNVPNPRSAVTVPSYSIRVIDPSQTVVYSQTSPSRTFTTKPITCSAIALASDFNTVGFVSTAYFTIAPVTNPSDSPMQLISVQFPSSWASQPIITSTYTTDMYCLSTQGKITCQRTSQVVTLSNFTFASSIQFEVHSVYSPSTVMSAGSIVVNTMTSSKVKLDSCSIAITGFVQDYFRLSSLNIVYSSNTLMDITVSTTFPSRATAGTIIYFTFPSNIPMGGSTCKAFLAGTELTGVNPFLTPGNNSISINPFSSLMFKPSIQLQCTGVTRPRSAFIMSNITISSRYNGNAVAGISCCSTVLQGRASLSVSSIITDKPYLQTSNAQYIITFTNTMPLLTTDSIYIYFPKEYSFSTGTLPCSINSATATFGSPTCTISTGNLIIVASFLSASLSNAAIFQLTINSIQNPTKNPSFTPFLIYLMALGQQIIEYNNAQYVSISAALINTFTVSVPNKKVLLNPSQYVFQFVSNGILTLNNYILIKLPVQVGVNLGKLSCSISQVYPCWYNSASNSIQTRITNTLSSTSITLTVQGLINPASFAPTDNFVLQILDQNSNIIQVSSILISTSLSMTTPSSFTFSSISFSPSVLPSINTKQTLQLILVSPIAITTNHTLTLTYNTSQLVLTPSSSCTPSSYLCPPAAPLAITPTSSSSFSVLINISNTIPLSPTPTLAVSLSLLSYQVLLSTIVILPTMPDLITFSLSQTNYAYAENTVLTVQYQLTGMAANGGAVGWVGLWVPQDYGGGGNTVYVNSTGSNGTVVVNGLTNPVYQEDTGYFYVVGYNANNQVIAISTQNTRYQPICTMPCRTCASNNTSNCLSCYSWHSFYIMFTNSTTNLSTCLGSCPRYYYFDNSTISCKVCDSNCLDCDHNSATKCLTCPNGKFLHQADFKCYTLCPSGFYGVKTFCRACPSHCLTCLNQSYCYTCNTGFYFYKNQCITGCPITTYSISSPPSCIACTTSNCLQCNQSQCLACKLPYYLYNKLCYLSCPAPLLPTISRICKSCQCASCSVYANNCTSCSPSIPYFHNNYCYKACPSGMYPSDTKTCTYCPLSCSTCSSASMCQSCKQSYSLYQSQCIAQSACPASTILTLSPFPICSPCSSPCLTCSISTSYCLSCISNYYLHNGTCVEACPGSMGVIGGQCKMCQLNCQECTGFAQCTRCQVGFYLDNGDCFISCPIGKYGDVVNKQCVACNPQCRTCVNATNCTSCTGAFLYNWFCYTNCPTTPTYFYQYNGVCTACQPQCLSCIDSPVSCTACSSPSYLYNDITHQCVFQCINPYFKNGTKCVGCQPPCSACDTTFTSCSSCLNGLFVYNGTCVVQCPIGFFGNSTTLYCQRCQFPCKMCKENQCLLCQSFSYMYQKSCVLVCPDQMPYQQPGYCSQCVGIGFCARCGTSSTTSAQICTQCVYPYVLFQQQCLNSCPTNYTATQSQSVLTCTKSQSYLAYLSTLQSFNRPIIPPFLILSLTLLVSLILSALSYLSYRFSYTPAVFIFLITLTHTLFCYYSIYFILTRFEPTPIAAYLLIAGCLWNQGLLSIPYIFVLKQWTSDIRYQQWKQKFNIYWWAFVICMPMLGGSRLFKIHYSKLFGKERFAFRIVSVEKFYYEDVVTLLTAVGDFMQIVACFILVYNVFIAYNGVMFIGYEIFVAKAVLWVLLLYDLKKPDRGFFIGDEEQAQIQILNQMEEEMKKFNRVDTENFVKLVRTKSAELIRNPKYFGELDVDDFISVYDPDDYQPVIKVPNKKIQKNIYRGKFRKGRKITVQQKINKFVDSIKPKPIINKEKTDSYLWKLIYWKPPDFKKMKPKQAVPPSQSSMLALLQQKQLEYKQQLDEIQLVLQQKQQRKYFTKPRYDQRTFLDDLDETIPNETVQFFYPSHSIDTNQKQNSLDFDDLMNLNYARKKHLQKNEQNESIKQQSKRKLHHQPQKKRRNLKGFGQMVLKNQY